MLAKFTKNKEFPLFLILILLFFGVSRLFFLESLSLQNHKRFTGTGQFLEPKRSEFSSLRAELSYFNFLNSKRRLLDNSVCRREKSKITITVSIRQNVHRVRPSGLCGTGPDDVWNNEKNIGL